MSCASRCSQWVLKITAYADRLLEDLKLVEWPSSTLEMQKNWIGRSIGADVEFRLAETSPEPFASLRPDPIRSSVLPIWCWLPNIRWLTP